MTQYNKWIEIDLDAIKNNLQQVQSGLENGIRLIAVIKNNAYGQGALESARVLYQNGVSFFAVSYLGEALELKQSGIKGNIMLLTPLLSEDEYTEAIKNNITLTIASLKDWEKVCYFSTRLRMLTTIHLKIETGLGRFGFSNAEEIFKLLKEPYEEEYVYIEGIYTHMAQAQNERYTQKQFSLFEHTCEKLEEAGRHIPIKHCANSTVFIKYPYLHLDAVRIGTLLTGQYPAGKLPHVLELKDPYKYKCRIISLKNLKKGSKIGYNSTYKIKKDAQIAVIPVGYCDGLALEVANPPSGFVDMLKLLGKSVFRYLNIPQFNFNVKIRGQYFPIKGKVFMQMALVEIPKKVFVQVGDEVEVPIKKTLTSESELRLYISKSQAGKKSHGSSVNYLIEGE
ncbi:MAG: alanine racemase [Syntrophomonadaceae bacterium]|nr:alanine racemase [Syntrophomonadaceae bacterium]